MHEKTTRSDAALMLPVGRLDGLPSLSYSLADSLAAVTQQWLNTGHLNAVWDLRHLQSTKTNIAALATFLAIAHRLRSFSETPPGAAFSWDPQLLAFLDDTKFLEILKTKDIIRIPEDTIGGYWHEIGKTYRYTRFFFFDLIRCYEPHGSPEWKNWRDNRRSDLLREIGKNIHSIFRSTKTSLMSPRTGQLVKSAAAELCLNAHEWGSGAAVLGVQRSRVGLTCAIADCGRGLVQSFADSTRTDPLSLPDHSTATVIAATYNKDELGLWRVIDEVTAHPGAWVTIWSYNAELHLKRPLWDHIKNLEHDAIMRALPLEVLTRKVPEEHRRAGYLRLWQTGIRGVRVTFEIPLLRR